MDDKYIAKKVEELKRYFAPIVTIEDEKYIRLILEAVWLSGEAEGISRARKAIKEG